MPEPWTLQEIVQEMAEMLLATQSADMYYSAKVLTGLDTTWQRDFIQRWILQLVNNSDNTRTLDPIRALERSVTRQTTSYARVVIKPISSQFSLRLIYSAEG